MTNAADIEIRLARHFDYRTNLIVPNVFWGFGLDYEADLVVVRASGFALEVEIKVTLSDLKADLKKRHGHRCDYFRELWFAMPEALIEKGIEFVPERAGVLAIDINKPWYSTVRVVRRAKLNKSAHKLDDSKVRKLEKLAAMRVWSLKTALLNNKRRKLSAPLDKSPHLS